MSTSPPYPRRIAREVPKTDSKTCEENSDHKFICKAMSPEGSIIENQGPKIFNFVLRISQQRPDNRM